MKQLFNVCQNINVSQPSRHHRVETVHLGELSLAVKTSLMLPCSNSWIFTQISNYLNCCVYGVNGITTVELIV